jgi:WD40 repeat protein/serine/threonine protein kinase
MSSASRDYGRFDELAEEFAERFRRGERPSLQEYVDRLPEMADEIREMFPALVEVEQADGDARGEPSPPPRAVAPRLSQVGDYRILREIGRGGMGVVCEAEQISLGRRVALKVLPGHAVGDRKALERFRREAKAAARMHHTNIVPVFEVGREGEFAFYAMQLIQGQGLDQVIDELRRLRAPDRKHDGVGHASHELPSDLANITRAGSATSILRRRELGRMAESLLSGRMVTEGIGSPLEAGVVATERVDVDATAGHAPDLTIGDRPPAPPGPNLSGSAVLPGGTHVSGIDSSGRRQPFFRSVAQIGRQAAQGLAHAHSRGIVHRDVKPSNLLLDTDGVVWITDFGLAKADDDGLTATGDILGTLRYMAPERFRGQGDARADIYALGMTLYELLTLRPAYDSSDRMKLIEQIKAQEPARPRSIDGRIPRDLETIVLKAIDKDPEGRYATAEAMSEDLRRFLADEPIKARQISTSERYWRWARRNPVVAVLGGVLMALLVVATVGSLLAANRFANLAERQGNSAAAERSARLEADLARANAETARMAAQTETYHAMLSEAKALRAGHQLGWRDEALGNLAQLTTMPTPRRDLVELRNEAVASLSESDVVEVARLEGFRSRVWSLDFRPDSPALVTSNLNGDLDLWDVSRRQHSWLVVDPAGMDRAYGGPKAGDPNIHARFLPDGGLVRITWSHRVEFLDSSGRPSARPPIDGGKAQAVGLEINRAGDCLAVGWDDGRIELRDAATGALRRSIQGDPRIFAVSPDGRWLALPGPNNAVEIQPTDGDGPPITLGRQREGITSLAFSPDGTALGSASWDHTATLWDVARREERVTLRGHKEKVTDLAFSPDGNWVATTSQDYTARIWDARNGQTLAVLPGPGMNHSVAFSPDGHFLAVSTSDQSTGVAAVSLYQIQGRRERRLLVGHRNGTQCLAFHPRSAWLASGSDDHDVIVWDAESAGPLRRWTAHNVYVAALAFSPDGSLLASGAGGDGSVPFRDVRLWDTKNGSSRRDLSGHRTGVNAIAFDPTGRRVATGDTSGVLIIWDVTTGRILRREAVGPSWIWSIAFIDEGRRLVTEVSNGPVVLYDLEGTDPPRRLAVPGGMRRFVVDRARNDLIVAGDDGILTRVSLRDLTLGHHLEKGHVGKIESLALHPDGKLLATGGGTDRRIILRDAETFEPLLTLPTWTGMVKDLAFDATGRWLAIAGADSDVGLWDLGLVRDELAAVGLAWDQPVHPVVSTADLVSAGERPGPQVPIIRPGNIDGAEFTKAQGLRSAGIADFEQGRFADAVVALQQASDRFESLRRSNPNDSLLARFHGMSLGYLAGSLRDLKRPGEALARFRESLAVYQSMSTPTPGDLYNMACACAMVSALDDRASPDDRDNNATRAVAYLRRAIDGDQARILPMVAPDRDFDPIRTRADFRDMMAEASFPRDPFKQPSPLALFESLSAAEKQKLGELSQQIEREPTDYRRWRGRGGFFARRSEWAPALIDFRKALELKPPAMWVEPDDTIFAMEAAVVLVEAADRDGFHRLARAMLDQFADSMDSSAVERTAKVNLLIPPPADDLKRVEALAQRSVDLGQGSDMIGWFHLVRGMSAYRSGEFATAVEWLDKASKSDHSGEHRSTWKSYLAMAEFRLGHGERARSLLLEAGELIAARAAQEDVGDSWHDLRIADMARREAEALINPTSSHATEPAKP